MKDLNLTEGRADLLRAIEAAFVKGEQRAHALKVDSLHFKDLSRGVKTFEVRLNDREYKIGDLLLLFDYDTEQERYKVNFMVRRVSYILNGGQYGIESKYVVMALIEPQ